jgi:hypothetical protein
MHRLAIDIGGTFTDLFIYDEGTGEITVAKGPTTPEDPSLGVVNVIDKAGVAMGEVVFFAHGSTIATNALVERNLAKTGLSFAPGIVHVPSNSEGGVSLGQYIRSINTNLSAGAGSQLDSLSLPGFSCCRYRSTDPSAFFFSLLRALSV